MKTISCPVLEKWPNWPSSPIVGNGAVCMILQVMVSTLQVMKLVRFWFLFTQVKVSVETEVHDRAVK